MTSLPNYDVWLQRRAPQDAPDEPCDRCGGDLGDSATKVKDPRYPGHWAIYCSDCAAPTERCDACHFVRCDCDE